MPCSAPSWWTTSAPWPCSSIGRQLRRLGLDVPDKMLQSYWAYTADLLEPIALCELRSVGSATQNANVGADSVLKTLDKSSRHGLFRGHFGCFVGTDGTVGGSERSAYGYTPSWDASEITEWFSAIDGFIQVDGYAGYSREVKDEDGQTRVAVPAPFSQTPNRRDRQPTM